jgi:hypothetical protein
MEPEDERANPYYARMMAGPVGHFGAYLMQRAFDPAMAAAIRTLDGTAPAPRDRRLHERLSELTSDERAAVIEVARASVIEALHGLLHGMSNDTGRIQLEFEGENLAEISDGLHGDLFDWLRDLSKHPYDIASDLDLQ